MPLGKLQALLCLPPVKHEELAAACVLNTSCHRLPAPHTKSPCCPAPVLRCAVRLQVGGAGSVEELAEALALRLARTAHRQSLDPNFLSPFTAELQERAGPDMGRILPQSGGKADDVTAVVAVVARG